MRITVARAPLYTPPVQVAPPRVEKIPDMVPLQKEWVTPKTPPFGDKGQPNLRGWPAGTICNPFPGQTFPGATGYRPECDTKYANWWEGMKYGRNPDFLIGLQPPTDMPTSQLPYVPPAGDAIYTAQPAVQPPIVQASNTSSPVIVSKQPSTQVVGPITPALRLSTGDFTVAVGNSTQGVSSEKYKELMEQAFKGNEGPMKDFMLEQVILNANFPETYKDKGLEAALNSLVDRNILTTAQQNVWKNGLSDEQKKSFSELVSKVGYSQAIKTFVDSELDKMLKMTKPVAQPMVQSVAAPLAQKVDIKIEEPKKKSNLSPWLLGLAATGIYLFTSQGK